MRVTVRRSLWETFGLGGKQHFLLRRTGESGFGDLPRTSWLTISSCGTAARFLALIQMTVLECVLSMEQVVSLSSFYSCTHSVFKLPSPSSLLKHKQAKYCDFQLQQNTVQISHVSVSVSPSQV